MTSRISFFKIAVEDMRHRVWMLALSCLGSFLALPVVFLMRNRDYLERIERNLSQSSDAERICGYYMDFFRTYGMFTVGAVLTLGALITAIWGFRYLYSRKMVDLYHATPVTRNRLFFVIYLNGLLIWLLPLLAATVVTLILVFANMASLGALSYFGAVTGMVLRLIGVAIICYLTLYHFLLVCVMLCGNVFNALFTSAVFGVSVAAFYGMLLLLGSAFFDTFVSLPVSWEQIIWASPLISPFVLMSDFANTGAGALFVRVSDSNYAFSTLMRLSNAALLLINLWIAHRLYCKRPSELAEHGVERKSAQVLIRSCASVLAGLFGSMLFLWMLDREAIGWQIFGILLCGILAFGVTDILLHMNFRSFFANKLQMAGTVLVACLLFFLFAFDLTGFDTRLPAKESIKASSLCFNNYGDRSGRYEFREDGVMYAVSDYYDTQPYENIDALYPLLERLTDEEHQNSSYYNGSIEIELETSFGPFRRMYRLIQSDLDVLRPIVESEEYLHTFYPASCGLMPTPESMQVYSEVSHTDCVVTDDKRMEEIMATYAKDFKKYSSLETLQNGVVVATLELAYPYMHAYSSSLSSYHLSLDIYEHFTDTIAKLKQYYPELILEKEKLNIVSLEIYSKSALADIFLGDDASASSSPLSSAQPSSEDAVLAEQKADIMINTQISITDEAEIKELLPYLHPGDLAHGLFTEFHEYQHIGYLVLANGYSINCSVRISDLPLKAPATVATHLEKLQDPQ